MQFRRLPAAAVITSVLVLSAFAGQQEEKSAGSSASSGISTEPSVLATIPEDEKPQHIAAPNGHAAPPAYFKVIFSESGKGAAYTAEKNGKVHVVHNGKPGKPYKNIGEVALSPDGARVAYGALAGGKWRMVVDGREGSDFESVGTPRFSPDGRHVAYRAMRGDKGYLVVDDTPSVGTETKYDYYEFSADSARIAYVETGEAGKTGRLFISDLTFSRQTVKKSVGNLLAVNAGRNRLAALQVVGARVRVIDFSFTEPGTVHSGRLLDSIESLMFGNDGSLSYVGVDGGSRVLAWNEREEALPDGNIVELPAVCPDKRGIDVLLDSDNGSFLHQAFQNSAPQGARYEEASGLACGKDGHFAYAARRDGQWFVVADGKEGPAFDRVVTPLFSPDGKRLIYRARKDGKRFVIVADTAGRTIRRLPDYEQVFQPVFTADGASIAYGVKDGNKLVWEVERL